MGVLSWAKGTMLVRTRGLIGRGSKGQCKDRCGVPRRTEREIWGHRTPLQVEVKAGVTRAVPSWSEMGVVRWVEVSVGMHLRSARRRSQDRQALTPGAGGYRCHSAPR